MEENEGDHKELKEELKQEEEMERSGIATVNSKESIEHMKEFVSENKNNGSNLLKSKEENELFKESWVKEELTEYLEDLYMKITEKTLKDRFSTIKEENDNVTAVAENLSEVEEKEDDNKIENPKKIVHFKSTIVENEQILANSQFYEPKYIHKIPDFFVQSPECISNTTKVSLINLSSYIQEKSKEQAKIIINPIETHEIPPEQDIYYNIAAQRYLCKLYQTCCLTHTAPIIEKPIEKPQKAIEKPQKAITTKSAEKEKFVEKSIIASPFSTPKQVAKGLQQKDRTQSAKKPDPLRHLNTIHNDKAKINDKIKEIEGKLIQITQLEPLKTPTRVRPPMKNQSAYDQDPFLKKMQEKKLEMESKKAQKLEEKENLLKADIEKLNSEKQKILEVFKLEKEKLFWRKMNELEERKADRIQKDMDYKLLVKNMVKNNQYPVKTPELDKRKQEIKDKKKLIFSEYGRVTKNGDKERSPPVVFSQIKKGQGPPKKTVRSVTPNQKPNYLIEIKQKNKEYQEKSGIRLKKDYENWEKYLKDDKLNKNEKYASVLNRAQIMENQAKMKEKVASFNGKGVDIDVENEINELYVDSIKAKIALLEKLKD